MATAEEKLEWLGLFPEEIEEHLPEDCPSYRADQIFGWLHERQVFEFAEMSNLPKDLRAELAEVPARILPEITDRVPADDGTLKFGLKRPDGEEVYEAVSIPQDWGKTLCLSSQIGCPVGCSFCQTGMMGFRRNLTPAEIVTQLHLLESKLDLRFSNIVYMGMGEPMLNVDNVIKSIRLLSHEDGRNFSQRKITVSTIGITDAMEQFIDAGLRSNLALSYHFTEREQRELQMPWTDRWPIDEVLELLKRHQQENGAKITLEYILLHGLNDRPQDVERLIGLAAPNNWHINLIEYNPVEGAVSFRDGGALQAPPRERSREMKEELVDAGIDTTLRLSKGRDADAACGQLGKDRGETPMAKRRRERLLKTD